jgi:hypothetical protein
MPSNTWGGAPTGSPSCCAWSARATLELLGRLGVRHQLVGQSREPVDEAGEILLHLRRGADVRGGLGLVRRPLGADLLAHPLHLGVGGDGVHDLGGQRGGGQGPRDALLFGERGELGGGFGQAVDRLGVGGRGHGWSFGQGMGCCGAVRRPGPRPWRGAPWP